MGRLRTPRLSKVRVAVSGATHASLGWNVQRRRRAAFLSTRFAIALLIAQRSGLIVNITAWDRDKFFGNLFYDVAKGAPSTA
jgi:hypothetical protein